MVSFNFDIKKNIDLSDAIFKNISKIKNKYVKYGFLNSAPPYPNGESVSQRALKNELGFITSTGKRVPPRPFFQECWNNNLPTYQKAFEGFFAKTINGTGNPDTYFLEKLGMKAAKDLQYTIVEFDNPPNAPETIAYKGFDDPLIETGHMLESVNYEVVTDA